MSALQAESGKDTACFVTTWVIEGIELQPWICNHVDGCLLRLHVLCCICTLTASIFYLDVFHATGSKQSPVYVAQVADRLNAEGVPCNLVTGQEVRRVPGAKHTACTVEMAELDTEYEVGACVYEVDSVALCRLAHLTAVQMQAISAVCTLQSVVHFALPWLLVLQLLHCCVLVACD